VQPDEFVTINVNVPSGKPVIINVVPDPVTIELSGFLVMVHEPATGSPFNTTLPDGTSSVGWVTEPIRGAPGVVGCADTMAFDDGTDVHPASEVTVKL